LLQRRPSPEMDRAIRWQARAAACLLVGLIGLSTPSGFAAAKQKPNASATAASAPAVTAPVADWPLGSERAQVTLLEYGSLTCSHCADFNNHVLPGIKAKYVDTGRVRYVFRAFPTPPMGLAYPMHSLARCAGPKAYHRVLDAFFQKQRQIFDAAQQGAGAKDAVYAVFTESSGMNAAQADICLRTQSFAEAVNQQSVQGEEMGVEGTPTLFIQTAKGVTRLPPPYDAQSVGRALDEAIATLPPPKANLPAKAKPKTTTKIKSKAKKP
jgi:protein-disulfide isomerase